MIVLTSCNSNSTETNTATNKNQKVTKNTNATNSSTKVSPRKNIPGGVLNASAFQAKLNSSKTAQVVDLRTHAELHQTGPLPRAILMDYNKPGFEQRISRLDKNKPTFIYCAGGNRSEKAYEKMQNMGFKEIYDLQGGINAWVKAGYKVNAHSH